MALRFLDLNNHHWKVFEKDMNMHMMSHVKVHSSTTDLIMLAKFGEILMELYALKPNLGIQRELATYLPLDSSVKQPYFPDTVPNQDLTPGTNSQPCGRHNGVYLIGNPMTTLHHQNHNR
jgi:hypothetical protein